jgi:hypothetical protein
MVASTRKVAKKPLKAKRAVKKVVKKNSDKKPSAWSRWLNGKK